LTILSVFFVFFQNATFLIFFKIILKKDSSRWKWP